MSCPVPAASALYVPVVGPRVCSRHTVSRPESPVGHALKALLGMPCTTVLHRTPVSKLSALQSAVQQQDQLRL